MLEFVLNNYLLLIHIILSLLGLLLSWLLTHSLEDSISGFVLILMMPFVGVVIFLYYIYLKVSVKNSKSSSEEFLLEEEVPFNLYNDLDVEEELKVLPLNDLLLISENHFKRERFLNIIKKDIHRYASYIKMALENKDGETSHYAAAVIQETKRKMDGEIMALMNQVANNNDDEEILRMYIEFLMTYLSTDLLQETERQKYVYEYINYAKKLVLVDKNEAYMTYLIDCLVEYEEYAIAKEMMDFYLANYPETINRYLYSMKIYYKLNDAEKLQSTIASLKASNIMYDDVVLNQLEFWSYKTYEKE